MSLPPLRSPISLSLVILAGGLVACGSRDPSIVLVTFEGVRAGDADPAAPDAALPQLAGLAKDGWSAALAMTTAPDAPAAAASVMTGLPVASHGLTDEMLGRLAPSVPVLAEELRARGYATGAIVGSRSIGWASGLARGFERFDEAAGSGIIVAGTASVPMTRGWDPSGRLRDPTECVQEGLKWLREHEGRSFLWLHLAAIPEQAPAPGKPAWGPDETARSLADIGRALEVLRQGLSDLGLDERTVLAAVSLTGYGRGEAGEWTNGLGLSDGTVHVPMILTGPGIPVERSVAPVSIASLYARLRKVAGIDAPAGLEPPVRAVTYAPLSQYGWSCRAREGFESAPVFQDDCGCAALPGAPAGLDDEAARQAEVVAVLIAVSSDMNRVARREPAPGSPAGTADSAADRAALAGALASADAEVTRGLLADPGNPALTRLQAALLTQFPREESDPGRAGEVSDALRALQARFEAAEKGSRCAAALGGSLAETLESIGRGKEAASLLAELLPAIPPENGQARLRIALTDVQERLDRRDAAADTLKPLADAQPGDPRLQERLGDIYLASGYGFRAAGAYERSLAAGFRTTGILMKLGDCRLQLKDAAGALELFREAADADPRLHVAHMKAGDALIEMNKPEQALEEFRLSLPKSASGFDEGIKLADRIAASGQDQMAFALYQDLAATDPRRFEPHYRIGELLVRIGKLNEAGLALDYAGTLAPKNPLIPYQLARIALARKDEAAALVQVEKAIALSPPELLAGIAKDPAFSALPAGSPVRAAFARAGSPLPGAQLPPEAAKKE